MKSLIPILYILMMLDGCIPAVAAQLQPLPKAPPKLNELQKSQQKIACDKIADALTEYQTRSQTHHESMNSYIQNIYEIVVGWFQILGPYEAEKKVLEPGTLEPMSEGAEEIGVALGYAYDSAAMLAGELDRIVLSLRDCSVTPIQK